ncbi:hypothetical protein [Vannielia sp.]|uniref:hypothetical protein n=1 Tax=Vannielia sp. TaxID=2813045 RepID=UPI002632B80E|nr:hypothetical protein [Vannielia sp.]MDF1872767.1 hypothetical protein [Vannielia sp.]
MRTVPLLFLFALAACKNEVDTSLLATDWSCSADWPGYMISRDLDYAPDGTLTGMISIQSTTGSPSVTMNFSVEGRWVLNGKTLEEKLIDQTLMRVSRDAENLPLTALARGTIPQMEARLADEPWSFEVVRLTAQEMELKDLAEGKALYCTR